MSDNLIHQKLTRGESITVGIDPTRDAFQRLRVSQPFTIWDSKLSTASHTIFWDDQETSGSGTGSTYSKDKASYVLDVSNTTAGTRVRQTKQRFNYQPGKSQFVAITATLGSGAAGITRRVGLFDENNGLFFELDGTTLSVVKRSSVSGSPVDTKVAQSSWEYDSMDGAGFSEVTLDLSKAQIFVIDFESLQVGTVRFGFYVDGMPIYVHAMDHANLIAGAYFSTPNLPVRYEISNDGTGAAAELEAICNTVSSEGGNEERGISRYISTAGTHVDADAADTIYALVGVKLQSTYLDSIVKVTEVALLSETNDNFEWTLRLNPTVAGTFTYNNIASSAVAAAYGATANTVTGGIVLAGGLSLSSSAVGSIVDTLYSLGSTISGTPDEIVLCAMPLSSNADIQGGMCIKEIA